MEIAIVIVAIVVAFLVFTWLIKVMRATFRTALLVALILLTLQLIFGIGPQALWENLQNWLSGSGQ